MNKSEKRVFERPKQASVRDFIARVFPAGTRTFFEINDKDKNDFFERFPQSGGNADDIESRILFPDWPPDLFLVTGLLLKRSGAYQYISRPQENYGVSGGDVFGVFSQSNRLNFRTLAAAWSTSILFRQRWSSSEMFKDLEDLLKIQRQDDL
ncbi:MAG: hypothetical protein ACFB2Z_04770 [Maricaulaceae bacterium]